MDIYIYKRPKGDELIVKNEEVYNYMKKKKIQKFSFGILLHINDYEWHHGNGRGILEKVFINYEEAEKHLKVYPCERDDIEDARTDKPIKITIQKLTKSNMIKLLVDSKDEPIFDIMHPDDINKIIPINNDK